MTADTDGAKATTASAPSRTTGTTPAGAQGSPAPPEKVDLSAWTKPARAAEAKEAAAKPARKRDPRVEWGQLGSVDGLVIVRIAHQVAEKNGKLYPWVGATVVLPATEEYPQGKRVFVLTGEDTVAGADLMSALRRGAFDNVSDAHPVPVRVRTAYSADFPTGRPMAFLTIG